MDSSNDRAFHSLVQMISFVRRSKNCNSQRIVSHVAMAKQKVISAGLTALVSVRKHVDGIESVVIPWR
jgi:hypothetical protein